MMTQFQSGHVSLFFVDPAPAAPNARDTSAAGHTPWAPFATQAYALAQVRRYCQATGRTALLVAPGGAYEVVTPDD